MKEHSKAFMKSHKGICVPNEAHEWLQKRAGEIQAEEGIRVSMGDVLMDAIRAIEDYEKGG
jgi:hypothetical protein